MKRLFTFGCSLTRYHWPTWADILGRSFDKFYNWGNRGAGNRQIFERFSEAVAKNTFTKDDIVFIQWTDYHRFDRKFDNPHLEETWYQGGNLLVDTENDPIKIFLLRKLWEENSYILHTWNFINAAVLMSKSLDCQVYMAFGNDISNDLNADELEPYRSILNYPNLIDTNIYQWTIQNYDKRTGFSGAQYWKNDNNMIDHHPTPIMYYHWLDTYVADKLNIVLDKEFANKMQNVVEQVSDYSKLGNAIRDAGYDTNAYYERGY